MSIAVVLGTRPEIVKMAPVVRALRALRLRHRIVHTGQHYSYEMDRLFFEQLRLRRPDVFLDAGSGSHAEQTALILERLEEEFIASPPDLVLVEGDTNTVLAGALAAAKLHIPVGHVEAGLRSFDRQMPEELNRIAADHLAAYHFAPTGNAKQLLAAEGIRGRGVSVAGNTVVDALRLWLPEARRRSAATVRRLAPGRFVLATLHRQENVDDPKRLRSLLGAIDESARSLGAAAVLPLHPRTRARIRKSRISPGKRTRLLDPLGYFEFLCLLERALLVMTDSGGVQEETCVLRVPCVTMRDSTERPESVAAGANLVAGVERRGVVRAAVRMAGRSRDWRNPYGDGHAAERIARVCAGHVAGKR